MRRMIREIDPERPSMRLSSLDAEECTALTQRRSTTMPDLIRNLRGDLDWIVIKTLEKDRTRRYETANGLAADIGRHLENEPIIARPPSVIYQFQKAWARNKAIAYSLIAILFILILGTTISIKMAIDADLASEAEKDQRLSAEEAQGLAEYHQRAARTNEVQALLLAEDMRLQSYAADILVADLAVKNLNLGKARKLLEKHRPSTGQNDLRGVEWRLLWGQSHGDQLRTLNVHSDTVQAVTFSPDGQWLLSSSKDGTVAIFNADSGKEKSNWKAHDEAVNSISFSSTMDQLATGGADAKVKLWSWPDLELLTTLTNVGGFAIFDQKKNDLFIGSGPRSKSGEPEGNPGLFVLPKDGRVHSLAGFGSDSTSFAQPNREGTLIAVGSSQSEVRLIDRDGNLKHLLQGTKGATWFDFSYD